jgi:hypothetical protein
MVTQAILLPVTATAWRARVSRSTTSQCFPPSQVRSMTLSALAQPVAAQPDVNRSTDEESVRRVPESHASRCGDGGGLVCRASRCVLRVRGAQLGTATGHSDRHEGQAEVPGRPLHAFEPRAMTLETLSTRLGYCWRCAERPM